MADLLFPDGGGGHQIGVAAEMGGRRVAPSTIEVFGYPQCILRRGEVIPVHSSAFYLVVR